MKLVIVHGWLYDQFQSLRMSFEIFPRTEEIGYFKEFKFQKFSRRACPPDHAPQNSVWLKSDGTDSIVKVIRVYMQC